MTNVTLRFSSMEICLFWTANPGLQTGPIPSPFRKRLNDGCSGLPIEEDCTGT